MAKYTLQGYNPNKKLCFMPNFPLSYLAKTSKVSDTLSFSFKNGLEFFSWVSFFSLEFFENAQKISLA